MPAGELSSVAASHLVEFEGLATTSPATKFAQCAKYWFKKDYLRLARLYPSNVLLNVVPLGFEGIARLKRIISDFNNTRETWEAYQIETFLKFCNALVREILGPDCDRCLEMVMKENGWSKVHDEVLMLASRGSGKTTLLTDALAVFYVHIPKFTCCLYAGELNKGREFFSGIVDRINQLLGHVDDTKRPGKSWISKDKIISAFDREDKRWIRVFSTHGMVMRSCFFFFDVVRTKTYSFSHMYLFVEF